MTALPVDLNHLNWLLGDWITSGGAPFTAESWVKVSDYTFEGSGKIRKADDPEFKVIETLRIVNLSGQIYYIAKVNHNPDPTFFLLTEISDSSAVFENPEHDFPKKIEYLLKDKDHLQVEVSAEERGFRLDFLRQQ